MSERLLICGAGNLGLYLRHLAVGVLGHEVLGFVDNFRATSDEVPVLGTLAEIDRIGARLGVTGLVYAIGYHNMNARLDCYRTLSRSVPVVSLVHPSAAIDPSAKVGAGCYVFAGAVVDRCVELEENVVVNVGGCIAHDSVVRCGAFLAPRVAIAGFCDVGGGTVLGINATVIDNVSIAPRTVVGAGSTVIDSIVEPSGVWVGSPARRIRTLAPDEVTTLYAGRVAAVR